MELTSSEKKVLSGISFNSESILNGELDEKETSTLYEMRAVDHYLHRKYPSYEFEITGCAPKDGTARDYNEWFFKAAPEGPTFTARSKELPEGFEIIDNFYGEVIKDRIDSAITLALLSDGFPIVSVNTSFWEFFGMEHGQDIPAKDVLTGKIHAGNDIKIFLDGSALKEPDPDLAIAALEKSLKKNSITGEVYVVILKSAEADPAKDRVCSDSFCL